MSINLINADPDMTKIEKNHLLLLDIGDDVELAELTAKVSDICKQVEESTHAVVVLRFINKAFCLRKWPGQVSIQDVNRWERAVRSLERLPVVVIAVASGAIGGPALDLLLATDYRIASADLQLHLPINEGYIWPGVAIHRLVNQIGLARSRQLLMGAHKITAQRAFDIGLIDEISDGTAEVVCAVASRFASMSSVEISVRRQLLLEASTTVFEDALGIYLAACDRELRRLYQGKAEGQRDRKQ